MALADELLALALAAAHRGAEVAVRMRAEGVRVAGTKSSVIDIVTDADRESERVVRQTILEARPDDGILGEEGSSVDGTSGVRWIVDPIDGTVNYLYGIPAYAVSIAAEYDGRVVAGVVRDVVAGHDYTATLGGGAFRDGVALACRDEVPQEQSLIATGFNYERHVRAHQAEAVARMLPQVRDIRRAGSCALDLCGVAAGRLDGYVEEGLSRRDLVAKGFPEAVVNDVVRKVDLNEYKRKQAAPGLKITPLAFGVGRRIPIVQKYVG